MNASCNDPLSFHYLQRMEIIEWWEKIRQQAFNECRTAAERISQLTLEKVESIPDRDLLLRREEALRPVHQQIEESIMAVNRSLAADLQMSLAESLERFGNLDTSLNASKVEMSVASAGAAAALASGGLALGATSLATTTSTIFFVIPVVTFSWPVFLVVGAAAAVTGLSFAHPPQESGTLVQRPS
ncbi:MAG: hypothetical protein OXC91_10860 [Rhodobacteraceae bacterium]|nr:hypothetical protein [Paracoccaceae bacterium]